MLLRFSVENFRSIREKQELTLAASKLADDNSPVPSPNSETGILTVAGIYGANASGKSNVLAALAFMETAVLESHRNWAPDDPIPVTPFLLSRGTRDGTSAFCIDIELAGVRHEYGFEIDAVKVHREWLYAYPRGRRRTWFERNAADAEEFKFGQHFLGENRTIATITRPNSLFLSAAAQVRHEQLRGLYRWFLAGIRRVSNFRFPGITSRLCVDGEFRERLTPLLRAADLGVIDIEAVEEAAKPLTDAQRDALIMLARAMGNEDAKTPEKWPDPEPTLKVSFRHRGESEDMSAFLSIDDESAGTRALFSLLGPVLEALEQGSLLIVDELDVSLHTLLAVEIVKLFSDRARNPKNAQLIFTSHDTHLLSSLRRDQIWFVEKDGTGSTHLYPLTDFKTRRDERIEKGYLQGRYGGIPFVGEMSLSEASDK